MILGDLEIQWVSGGHYWLDGGSMFGVVPKTLWTRVCPCDNQNRVLLDTNCLLVRTQGKLVLVDAGFGSKATQKQRDIYALQGGNPIVENLGKLSVQPDDVDIVILTHLHFDHVGGCTLTDNTGQLRPTFPRARHLVQRTEWQDAVGGAPELAGAYFVQDFLPLQDAGLVELLDGDTAFLPGMSARLVGGHTRGQQILYFGNDESRLIYLADLCGFAAHLKILWTMAYDQFPLATRRTKPAVFGEAATRNWPVVFSHDPKIHLANIRRDEHGNFQVSEPLPL